MAVLPGLLLSPLMQITHLGTFEASYVAAGGFLVAGSLQWLAIGRRIEVLGNIGNEESYLGHFVQGC